MMYRKHSATWILLLLLAFWGQTLCFTATTKPPSHDNRTAVGYHHEGDIEPTSESNAGSDHHNFHAEDNIMVAGWHWEYVKKPFIITIFLIAAAVLKLGFHHVGKLPLILPESCILIVLGTVVGVILYFSESNMFAKLRPSMFFLILLPPIVLESAYSLYDRVFFENLATILIYAVLGTALNCFLIAPALYLLAWSGAMGTISISLANCFVFSSLIVAVDPVAVLAIFQEIGVNNVLYFLVFGESLLNDAVTVVLYNMMNTFNAMDKVRPMQYMLAFISLFTISLVGMVIGIIFGCLSALITKYTEKVRVVEPLAIFALAYASYLTADLFQFSGIISILSCGLVQAHFAFHNVSHKSLTTVLYFAKVVSTTSESIIFLFLGLALVNKTHVWHTGFVLWTLLLCLVVRFIGVYFLSFVANKTFRVRRVDYEEQFIMAYGGLRGAVAFSLVAMLDNESFPGGMRDMFATTTLVVVLFTVFIQGSTIKPLVNFLRIRKEGEKVVCLFGTITNHVVDHVMAGIEEIVGDIGRNALREMIDQFDDKYLKKILQRDPMTKDQHIMELYKEIAIQDHYNSLSHSSNMRRYSSQIQLYHPVDKLSEAKSDPFVSMAMAHPELANRALDKSLRRSSQVSRKRVLASSLKHGSDGAKSKSSDTESGSVSADASKAKMKYGWVDLSKVSGNELKKYLISPNQKLHQKADRTVNTAVTNDLVTLLQEKQRRTNRYIRSISVCDSTDSSSDNVSGLFKRTSQALIVNEPRNKKSTPGRVVSTTPDPMLPLITETDKASNAGSSETGSEKSRRPEEPSTSSAAAAKSPVESQGPMSSSLPCTQQPDAGEEPLTKVTIIDESAELLLPKMSKDRHEDESAL